MIRAAAPVAALLFGTAILLTGQGLQGTLLPVRATLEQFSTISIGLMGAAYFLGFTYGCWKGAELIRGAGHVRVFAAMTAIASATPLLHGLWVNPWLWGSLRFVSGFCFAVVNPSIGQMDMVPTRTINLRRHQRSPAVFGFVCEMVCW